MHCGFHAGWCFAVGPRSMGKLCFAFSAVAEGRRCSVARTCNEVVLAHKEFLRARQTPVPLICIVCWVVACTAPGTRYFCRLRFLFFLLSASGGWVKIKLELPRLLARMYQIHVFRFNPRSRCNSSSRCWYRAREHVDPA